MGLAFNQVDGAIITKKTLSRLAKINKRIAKTIRIRRYLPLTQYPKVVIPKYNLRRKSELKHNVEKIFLALNRQKDGKLFFRFLNITRFN